MFSLISIKCWIRFHFFVSINSNNDNRLFTFCFITNDLLQCLNSDKTLLVDLLACFTLHSMVGCVQYFPGRPIVKNLLNSANSWLQNQTGGEVSYMAFREILDNTAQVSKLNAAWTLWHLAREQETKQHFFPPCVTVFNCHVIRWRSPLKQIKRTQRLL